MTYERLQAYTPTMAEVYRFMQSNPISSREMLDEISAESTPKSSWDMHLQSFIKLEKQCREIAEQIYDFIGESHNDADAELRFQEVSTNLAAFICETKGLAGLMGSPVRCPALAKPAQQCHADSDGDCSWSECPQEANNRANYQVECPLSVAARVAELKGEQG